MENRMESYVAKSELARDELQLRLTVRTEQRAREVRANRQVEKAIDATRRRADIHDNVTCWYLLRSSDNGQGARERKRTHDEG